MNTTTIFQSTIDPTIKASRLDECITLALSNVGNPAYLSWIEVYILYPIDVKA
jgi:hypothetical protein